MVKLLEEDTPGLAADLRAARMVSSETGPWKLIFGRAFDADRARRHEKEIEAKLTTARGRSVRHQQVHLS